jgi:predicted nucleotide-binding protein
MVRNKSSVDQKLQRKPTLVVTHVEAEERISRQIDKGKEIWNRAIYHEQELVQASTDKSKWKSYTFELLTRIFDDHSIAEDFSDADSYGVYVTRDMSLSEDVVEFKDDIRKCLNNLESLLERIELIPSSMELQQNVITAHVQKSKTQTNKVFIVHGHDNEAKQSAARFVEKLGLEAVIFHEQEDMGQTIIEKLERVSDVNYAIVLLTPDDVAHSRITPEQVQNRARQNVIFEWGYLMSKLGRRNVSALIKGNVEVLSDLQGLLWTTMDDGDAWKYKITKEMRTAGLDADSNKI